MEKCKSCGACKECGAQPQQERIVYVPMPVYVQPAPGQPLPVYPRWDGPIWQVFPNTTGGFVTSTSTILNGCTADPGFTVS